VTLPDSEKATGAAVSAVTDIETMPMLGRTVFGGLDAVGKARLQLLVRAITARTEMNLRKLSL
jgi:hypothetical protein